MRRIRSYYSEYIHVFLDVTESREVEKKKKKKKPMSEIRRKVCSAEDVVIAGSGCFFPSGSRGEHPESPLMSGGLQHRWLVRLRRTVRRRVTHDLADWLHRSVAALRGVSLNC